MWISGHPNFNKEDFLSSVITDQILRELEGRPEIVMSGIVWR